MAWIPTIRETDATDELARLYQENSDPNNGSVDNILKVHSLEPRGLEAHLAIYRHAMRGTPTLRKADRELIAVAVSEWNGCHY